MGAAYMLVYEKDGNVFAVGELLKSGFNSRHLGLCLSSVSKLSPMREQRSLESTMRKFFLPRST